MEITSSGNNLSYSNVTSASNGGNHTAWSYPLSNVTNSQARLLSKFARAEYYSLTRRAAACVEALNAKLAEREQCEEHIGRFTELAPQLLAGSDSEQHWRDLEILESLRILFKQQCTDDNIPASRQAGDSLMLISSTSQQMIHYTQQERAKCGDCYNQLSQHASSQPIALDITNHTDPLTADLVAFNGHLQHLHPMSVGGELAENTEQQLLLRQSWYQHFGDRRSTGLAQLEKCVLKHDKRIQALAAVQKSAERPLAYFAQLVVKFYQWVTAGK
ncbi:hypothetical protein N5923_04390 [Erwiniaceae bacterium BAC15a-03b]|uniref:Uncharacterized protein n=1 Tax=Winslowiella arboricola TaxID=2978220 RepID=A0A9J6PJT2_9GAMM|nr:hypothetical protein [Winslowiella arboricola]MCU5773415.1 hypothetical protein [Winslowiella arboricola]MCU5776739.1 hypothetical protein [Winslowiella arboricola]